MIKIDLITGFLGSGKTTFIRYYAKHFLDEGKPWRYRTVQKHHNRLWNGGNGWGTVRLYDRIDDRMVLVDEKNVGGRL